MRYTKENLEPIIKKSKAFSEVLRLLSLKQGGGSQTHIRKLVKKFEIDTSHFLGQRWNLGVPSKFKLNKEEFIEKILKCNGAGWKSHEIKCKLYEFNLKEEKCEKCEQKNIWNGEKLGLELHHINGNHEDNRIENLKILCPNCHSQIPRIKRKLKEKKQKKERKINVCSCGKPIQNKSKICVNCYAIKQRKVIRPNYETLVLNVKKLGYVETGKMFGVSDNAVRKWIKIYEKNNF